MKRSTAIANFGIVTLAALGAAAFFAAGCAEKGIDYFPDRFAFPAALALHTVEDDAAAEWPGVPRADYAYVVSTNFDLAYRSGMVQVVDLEKLHEMIDADQAAGDRAVGARRLPAKITSVFATATYQPGGVKIGSFGGELAITRLYDRSAADEAPQTCQRDDECGAGEGCDRGAGVTFLACATGACATPPGVCAPYKTVGLIPVRQGNYLTPLAVDGDGKQLSCLWGGGDECGKDDSFVTDADDPFGIALATVPTATHPAGEDEIFVTHLLHGEIQAYPLRYFASTGTEADRQRLRDARRVVATHTFGTTDLVFSRETGLGYVATRVGRTVTGWNLLALFDPLAALATQQPADVTAFVDVASVVGGTGLRGLATSPNGRLIYAASWTPNAVLALDVTLRPGGSGPRNRVVARQTVGGAPTRVALLDLRTEAATPAPENLLYVTCTGDDSLYILKTPSLDVVQVLDRIGDGPYDVVVYKRPPAGAGEGETARDLFVALTNFEEGTVVVMQVDPETLRHRPLARVGTVRSTQRDFK